MVYARSFAKTRIISHRSSSKGALSSMTLSLIFSLHGSESYAAARASAFQTSAAQLADGASEQERSEVEAQKPDVRRDASKILYTALFVDNQEALLSALGDPPLHTVLFAHHVTLAYQPKQDQVDILRPGTRYTLRVLSRYSDSKGDAVLVELPAGLRSKNKYPHITLSVVNGTGPVYSNELIENETKDRVVTHFDPPILLSVTEGYQPSDRTRQAVTH